MIKTEPMQTAESADTVFSSDSCVHERLVHADQIERTLTEIRSGRRLEKIASSVESFLHSQITRLETALEQVRLATDNDRIVQSILADFEREKQAWDENRQAEIRRLSQAGDELIQGWQQLENERQAWLDQKNEFIPTGEPS